MTVNNTIIKELAHQYFADNMPKELIAYLYDQYGEEPLAGDLAPQFFWPRVESEIKKYIHRKLIAFYN